MLVCLFWENAVSLSTSVGLSMEVSLQCEDEEEEEEEGVWRLLHHCLLVAVHLKL